MQPATGGEMVQHLAAERPVPFPLSISPDGKHLLLQPNRAGWDIDILSLDDQSTEPLLSEPFDERNAVISGAISGFAN